MKFDFDFSFEEVISPPTLWIAAKNSSVVLVKWLPPKYGQASIEEYHLFYVQIQEYEKEKGPFIVGRQHQSYSLRGLSKFEYLFIINCFFFAPSILCMIFELEGNQWLLKAFIFQ